MSKLKSNVRVVAQVVERRRDLDGLAAPGVADERDVAHVHLPAEGVPRLLVPCLEELQVPEEEPPPRVVLTADPAVDEVLVDAGHDESAAGQELPQVVVAGVREVLHVVVAVHHQNQRIGTGAVGIPDPGVQGHLLRREAPVLVALLRRASQVDHLRHVDGGRLDGHRVPVDGAVLVGAAPVVERAHPEGSGEAGVGGVEDLTGEYHVGVARGELQGRSAGSHHHGQTGAGEESVRGIHGGEHYG